MPVTPGAAGKLNTIKGISKIITTSSAEESTLASKVFPAGLIVKKSDGKIYVTDGVTTLGTLNPVVCTRSAILYKVAQKVVIGIIKQVLEINLVAILDSFDSTCLLAK